MIMFKEEEEDEYDSSNLVKVASQSDVSAFLQAQSAKITGLNSTISDDDDDDDDDDDEEEISIIQSSIPNFIHSTSNDLNNNEKCSKAYLSQSCFASISNSSSQKQTNSDDLTELNWLSTFKFKENKTKENNLQDFNSNEDQISKLCNELKIYDEQSFNMNSSSFGVLIFLALYSKRDDKQTPWLLTIKQLYEYIQINVKHISYRHGWRDLLKEALVRIPCFIKTKRDTLKSRSVWTIDPYYRPLLTRAYLTRVSLDKTITNNQDDKTDALLVDKHHLSETVVNECPPKSTVKTKVLHRLYERLREEKQGHENKLEIDLRRCMKERPKRPFSTSVSNQYRLLKDNDGKQLSSFSPTLTRLIKRKRIYSNLDLKTFNRNNVSKIVTPCPSIDHMYLNPIDTSTESIEYNDVSINENDVYENHLSIDRTSKATVQIENILENDFIKHRQSSSSRKSLSLVLPTHRRNTRMNRKIIEQDLELLRKANNTSQSNNLPILPSNQSIKRHSKNSE